MAEHPYDEKALVRFFLGHARDEERQGIEDRCVTDGAFFEAFEATEEKLIDDYLDGLLSPGDAAAFDSHYLASPRRRRKLDTAKLLRQGIQRARSGKRADWRLLFNPRVAVPALIILMTLGGAYRLLLRDAPAIYQLAEGATKRTDEPRAEIVVLLKRSRPVRLRLELSSTTAYESRRAILRPIGEDQVVWTGGVFPQTAARTLEVEIDFTRVRAGDYLLTLETAGGTTTSSYTFRLTRK